MYLLVISLLALLAGILLLAKAKKEQLGRFFTVVSWFFIVVGFLLFAGFLAGGIYQLAHKGKAPPFVYRHEMLMKRFHPGMQGTIPFPGAMHMGGCCKQQAGCAMHMGDCCKQQACCSMKAGGDEKACCKNKAGCKKMDSTMKCCPKMMPGDTVNMSGGKICPMHKVQ